MLEHNRRGSLIPNLVRTRQSRVTPGRGLFFDLPPRSWQVPTIETSGVRSGPVKIYLTRSKTGSGLSRPWKPSFSGMKMFILHSIDRVSEARISGVLGTKTRTQDNPCKASPACPEGGEPQHRNGYVGLLYTVIPFHKDVCKYVRYRIESFDTILQLVAGLRKVVLDMIWRLGHIPDLFVLAEHHICTHYLDPSDHSVSAPFGWLRLWHPSSALLF